MFNNEQDKTIQICLSIVFTLGVIAVVVYMVFGSIYAVYASLGIYAFSFSLISLLSIRKLFLIAAYKDRLRLFEAKAEMTQEEKESYETKKNEVLKVVSKTKAKEITKAIIFGAIAIFAVVVLVLF